jgi:predicted Fe-Mo cluster-binding NifX family protein
VVAGIAANYFKIPYVEGLIGVAISGLILKVGFETAKESLFFLLDYFNDQKLLDRVTKLIMKKSRIVKEVKDIRMRRAGTYIFGEAFLDVNPFAQTKDIRNELKNIEEEIVKKNKYLKNFLLFVMIPHPANIKVAVPVKEDRGLESEIASTMAETNAYVFVNVKKDKIDGSYSKAFKFSMTDFEGIINFLEGEGVNVVINNDMHSLLFYHLRRLHNIEVYPNFSNVTNARNAVKLLLIDT